MNSAPTPVILEHAAPAREADIPVERDSLRSYLQEIGKTPLLTREEEVVLAGRIKRGDAEARNHMIKANLRLVVKLAMDYRDFGLPLLDLISEGNLGLIKAVGRFDPNKGGKLSTYAAWWIKRSMQRALANQSKTIRLPVHAVAKIAKLRKTARVLAEQLGRDPTDEELAIELQIPVSKVAHLKSVAVQPASLDAPLSEESDSTSLGEVVGDENATSPDVTLREKDRSSGLRSVVDALDARESEIIRLRFGLAGQSEMTLEEVGRKFNVIRERIRQIEQLALMKMRRLMAEQESQRTAEEVAAASRSAAPGQGLRRFFEERIRQTPVLS